MKRFVLALLVLAWALPGLGQTRPATRYCIVEARVRPKDKAVLKLLPGAEPASASQAEEAQQVAKLDYERDALDYLGSRGWEVFSVTTVNNQYGLFSTRYYLRRAQP